MNREPSLTASEAKRQPLRYKMVVESTDAATIKTALPHFPNGILIETHRGFMLAVPVTPDDADENRI